jgi:hypothetical protein
MGSIARMSELESSIQRRTVAEDPAQLRFADRTDLRPLRRAPRSEPLMAWILMALLGLFAFSLIVREMAERSADTAGPASIEMPSTPPAVGDAPASPPAMPNPRRVYRCASASGAVVFQSDPCARGQATTATYEAQPDSSRDVARARAMQRLAEHRANEMARIARTERSSVASVTATDPDARRAHCAAAKASRASTLRAAGLSRTYELLQRLDAMVYEACKGLD